MQLFGLAIPPEAVRLVVRPVTGRGNAPSVYEATLADGRLLASETDLLAEAAQNKGFWLWVQKQVEAKKIDASPSGLWEWKVRLEFFDAGGAKTESAVSERAFEFYQLCATASAAPTDPVSAALQAMRDMQAQFMQAQERMARDQAQLVRDVLGKATELVSAQLGAGKDIVATAATEAHKVLAAGAEPLKAAVDRIVEQSKHEQEKRDEATKDVCTLLKRGSAQEPDFLSQLSTGVQLFKAVKPLLPN